MKVKWIEKKNNPFYPLPADYNELDKDGQRQARVNACRLWLCPGRSKEEIAESFATSVKFFDLFYLCPDHEVDFDPLFYDDDPLETPTFHYDILRSWASSNRNITIAPRGSAKSFLVRKSCLLRMLARPMYTILYATSTNDNAKGTGQALKDQFLHNQRILDDWAPEFPDGRIAPKRGEAPFGTEQMQLKNGSWLRAISAESRQRGGRPRRYVLDDPEYDPKASTSMSIIRQYMDDLLFKIVLPMVMRKGCGVDWLATFVSRRHYAWHALQTEESTSGERVATDPRFNLWSRMIVRAAYEGEDGELKSCWPAMWPSKKTGKDDDRVSLEEIKEIIGTANFLAEYMARPGESGESFFPAITKEKHGWWITQADEKLETNPRLSEAYIHWFEDQEEKRLPMNEFLNGTRLFMSVDTSYTATTDSDYKVACLMAVNSNNDLFVLDLWSGQCQESRLVQEIFKMADKWKCPSIHPEVIKQGIGLFHNIESIIKTRALDMAGVTHLPAVKKLNPGQLDKASKIAALNLRFEHGKIKMPLWKRNKPQWARLLDQVEQFNPDAKDGGLQHDDELDCVCMSQFILRGRVRAPQKDPEAITDPIESLKEGRVKDSMGNPIAFGVDFRTTPMEDILEILDQHEWDNKSDGSSRV
tara:strand:+ start:17608 stop:19539 length:1932 start_codon:yes stop_codon:yes gene_type:complete